MKGAAHVVPEHSKQEVSRLIHFGTEVRYRLGQSFVDGLVEADHLPGIRVLRFAVRCPHAKDGGTKRPVFGRELVDVKTALGAEKGMCLRGSFRRVSRTRRKSLRLEQLLLRRLWGNDVSRDGLEDLCCVVSQSQSIHSCGRWQLGGGK
jgi:hypothetical protein